MGWYSSPAAAIVSVRFQEKGDTRGARSVSIFRLLFFLCQYCPSAIHCAAVARKTTLGRGRVTLLENVGIIVSQFFSRCDIPNSLDPDSLFFHDRIAIGIAGMIDEARLIPINCRIDHYIVIDGKQIRMMSRIEIVGIATICLLWSETLTRILDDARACANELGRECAEPLDWRRPYLKPIQAGV